KGRYRQFNQLGVEAFGMPGADVEAELLMMCAAFWERIGIAPHVRLELNNLGAAEDRARFGRELKAWLLPRRDALDADSQRRLDSNVLRILDSKVESTRALLADAPRLDEFVS